MSSPEPGRASVATGLAVVLLVLPVAGVFAFFVGYSIGSEIIAVALAGGLTAIAMWVAVGRRIAWWKAATLALLSASGAVAVLVWAAHAYGS